MQIVRVTVGAADAELLADRLWTAGATAVSIVDRHDGTVCLTADAEPGRIGDITAGIPGAPPVEIVDVDPTDGLDAWRDFAEPVSAGDGFVLVPAWQTDHVVTGDRRPVWLDPGHTFGSGSHVTTRRCVAALEAVVRDGDLVVDAGCGSGVLGVVAAQCGARKVIAFDPDPGAMDATRHNAALNGVTALVDVVSASVGDPDVSTIRGAQVVVANIGVRVLVDHAASLCAMLDADGVLIVSGLLDGQLPEVERALSGLVVERRWSDDGWSTAVLRAPSDSSHRSPQRPTP